MSTFNKKRNYFVCGWVGKVLFVFLNVDLNFFGCGWVGKSKNEIITFLLLNVDICSRLLNGWLLISLIKVKEVT